MNDSNTLTHVFTNDYETNRATKKPRKHTLGSDQKILIINKPNYESSRTNSPSSTLMMFMSDHNDDLFDYGDDHNDSNCLEYDQFQGLLQREENYFRSFNTMMTEKGGQRSATMFENDANFIEWRKEICKWLYRVVGHWNYDRHTTVSIALNLLDRSLLASPKTHSSFCNKKYQLTAMTCLYIAFKLMNENEHYDYQTETYPCLFFKLSSFVDISYGKITSHEVCEMEFQVLQALNWHVHAVTPNEIIKATLQLSWKKSIAVKHAIDISQASTAYQLLEELSIYICELSSIHLGITGTHTWRPRVIAFASLLQAMQLVTDHVRTVLLDEILIFIDDEINHDDGDNNNLFLSVNQLISVLKETKLWYELIQQLLPKHKDDSSTSRPWCIQKETIHPGDVHDCNMMIISLGHSLGMFDLNAIHGNNITCNSRRSSIHKPENFFLLSAWNNNVCCSQTMSPCYCTISDTSKSFAQSMDGIYCHLANVQQRDYHLTLSSKACP